MEILALYALEQVAGLYNKHVGLIGRGDKQVAPIGGQTHCPYWETHMLPLLKDWGTNMLPLLRD